MITNIKRLYLNPNSWMMLNDKWYLKQFCPIRFMSQIRISNMILEFHQKKRNPDSLWGSRFDEIRETMIYKTWLSYSSTPWSLMFTFEVYELMNVYENTTSWTCFISNLSLSSKESEMCRSKDKTNLTSSFLSLRQFWWIWANFICPS